MKIVNKKIILIVLISFFMINIAGINITAQEAEELEEILVNNIFYDTFIMDALSDLSAQTGVPIIADNTVSGFVTMELVDLSLEDALQRLCIPGGYTYRWMEGGFYLIGAAEVNNPTFERLSETEVVKTKYLKAIMVSSLISDAYNNFIKVDEGTNSLVITASPELIDRIKRDIKEIDMPVKQVMLEVLVTELSANARKSLGTNWQWNINEKVGKATGIFENFAARTLSATLGFSQPSAVGQFFLQLQALAEDGEVDIHANPRIVAMDGKTAEIFLGEEQNFIIYTGDNDSASRRTIMVKSGVSLYFLPHISPDNKITLEIKPEVSFATGVNNDGFPIISTREANTTIRVEDGETFVLGGLLQQFEDKTMKGIPFLRDIPLLGKMFRSERSEKVETEVVIMVTPKIIEGE